MPVMERYMTVEEVAQELRVSKETVIRYIKREQLPALKLGGVYRILEADYERFKDIRRTSRTEKTES